VSDDINAVVSSMDQLTTTTLKAGIEFKGFTKKITSVAASTEGAGKAWTTFSRLVSGTPLWAFQNKMRAYLSIIAGFETRSKANTEAAVKERRQLIDSIKGYQSLSKELKVLDDALEKTRKSTLTLTEAQNILSEYGKKGSKLPDSKIEDALKLKIKLTNMVIEQGKIETRLLKLNLKESILADGKEKDRITTLRKKAEIQEANSIYEMKSLHKTINLFNELNEEQIKAYKNTVEYQQVLLATDNEDLAIRRGIEALSSKRKILDEEHQMRVQSAKLAYAQDEKRIKFALKNAKKLADARGYATERGKGLRADKTFKLRKQMEKRAVKGTKKRMSGEMSDLADDELGKGIKDLKKGMMGSVENIFPLVKPIGAIFKIGKLVLTSLSLRTMTAAKFRAKIGKLIQFAAPIMKMAMLYLIYAILFIVAAAVIFNYLKEFYDILKDFGVIEEIKEFGMQAWSVALTFFKAIQSFFSGDFDKGLGFIITGAEKLGKLLLVGAKLALKIGFLALVAGLGMAMVFIKELITSKDLQEKVGKLLMYVLMAVAAFLVVQFLIGLALTALAFLAIPALIIVGIAALLFAIQYYFGEKLETMEDYFRAALEPIEKFLFRLSTFVLGIPDLLTLLVTGAITQMKKIFKIDMPQFGLPQFANGGTSKGGMALVGEKGPELVNLSKGSRVFSNAESRKMVGSSSTVNNFNITINAKDTSKAEMRRIANELGTMINNKMNRTGATRTMR
jgi:hypothetical protein